MLDKFSVKLLKLLNGSDVKTFLFADPGTFEGLASQLGCDEFAVRPAVDYLCKGGYLTVLHDQHGNEVGFSLSHKGIQWEAFRRHDRVLYLEDKWIDFFALILSVAALIISLTSA